MPNQHLHLSRRSTLRIQQLDMLLHLMETRSISVTADKLGLTQSAVTKSLKELESGFSVRLFERTPRGLMPTIYGEVLERFAHDVVIGLQSAHEAIRALRCGERGHVVVGLVPGASQGLVARAIQQVRGSHPGLSIELQVDRTDSLLDALHAGIIDFAVVHPSSTLDLDRFDYIPAGNESLCLLTRLNHPLAGAHAMAADLAACTWALPPRDEPVRQLLDAAMASAAFPLPSDVIELPMHAGVAEFAQQLDVVVLLTDATARPYVQQGVLKPLHLPFELPSLPFGLLRARNADASAGACAVLHELRQAVVSAATVKDAGRSPHATRAPDAATSQQ